MGHYIPGLRRRAGNLMFMNDGTICANYWLQGINVNSYNAATIASCQDTNELLFSQLSRIEQASEFLIRGTRVQTPPSEIMNRCVRNIPDFDNPERYRGYRGDMNAFYNRINTGEFAEYRRENWLSIHMPFKQSWTETLLTTFAVIDPHRNIDTGKIREIEDHYFRSLPSQFLPQRTNPDHVRWMHDRIRRSGMQYPLLPSNTALRLALDGPETFANVLINKNADTDALMDEFVDRIKEEMPELTKWQRRWAIRRFRENFRTMRHAAMLSVHNVEDRIEGFPDGYTSYQSNIAIARYPDVEQFGLNAFTNIVDQPIEVDADYALRFDFSQQLISKTGIRKSLKELGAEAKANTEDVLDAEEYQDHAGEMLNFRRYVRQESDPRGMRVAALFSFSHQRREFLQEKISELRAHFTSNDFTPSLIVGGQDQVWRAMMPGSSCPKSVDQYKQVTTARLFSGFMPLRRSFVGDPVGVPIAINRENDLGQIVHYDIIGATDKGNGSAAVVGAKGSGKSSLEKKVLGYFDDLELHAHVNDQSKHGEYVVFARTLTDPEIVDVVNGWLSMDILKIFADDPDTAMRVFMETWGPLLRATRGTEERALLLRLLDPIVRSNLKIKDTRDLVNHIIHHEAGEAARNLAREFVGWSREPYSRVFIDPDNQEKRPAFSTTKRIVVFRTHGLKVYRGSDFENEASDAERFAALAFTVIAEYTAWRFNKIRETCAFLGDEMHFMTGSNVLELLVENVDRTGRALGNIVFVATQLSKDLSKHYDLINKKWVLKQETAKNSKADLTWADIPATERIITRHVTQTSPADPTRDNEPRLGREGEGWYNDGINTARIQTLPHLRPDRARHADTTSSKMIHADELPPLDTPELVGQT